MTQRQIRLTQWLAAAAVPAVMMGFSTGPPVRRTGAMVDDNGNTCFACHRDGPPVNQGGGSVRVNTSDYIPGVKQNVQITIRDLTALRWGFQITSRLASDETKQAGSFTTNPTDLIRVRCAAYPPNPADGQGRDACVPGDLEFASHRQASTRAGSGGPEQAWVLEWTPPAEDVGPVIFYVAGNAANNSNSPVGDKIYTASVRIGSAGCALPGPLSLATGVPSPVLNSAGGQPRVSSNAMISIYGAGFFHAGATYQAQRQNVVNGKLSASAGCVSVEVGGKPAPILFINGNQINAQAPILPSGTQQVKVTINKGTPAEKSIPGTAAFDEYSPAFFVWPNSRSIIGLTQRFEYLASNLPGVPNGVAAKPGEIVILYGTGFGFTEPVYQTGEFAVGIAPLRDPITVSIGGIALAPADILYAGLASDAPGFYQFNFRVPAGVPDGDAPVRVTIGGQDAQPTGITIPVRR